MQAVRIVQAQATDIPVILNFIHKLADYEHLAHDVVVGESELRAHLFGEHRAAEVVLALEDEHAVGFALFFTSFSTFLGRPGIYLEDIFVEVEKRGRGIGKALLKHLAQLAEKRGSGRLEWAVLKWNKPSIAFYESIGARPLSEWTTYRLTGPALHELGQ